MYKIIIFLVFITVSLQLRSQILPKDGSNLNYRIIGFSFPASHKADIKYTIEIAAGNYSSLDSFKKNIIFSKVSKSNKIIAEVPAFGSDYTWYINYSCKTAKLKSSPLYHFSTVKNDRVDTTKTRLNILQPADTNKDAYVAVGAGGVIYDMQGNPVWCIADTYGKSNNLSDLKFTPQHTITFMIDQAGYEINYDSKVLWQTPPHDTLTYDTGADYYHHEFTRLSNGHYMILGTEFFWYKKATVNDSTYFITTPDRTRHNKYNGVAGVKDRGRYGILIELDEKGNVVWSWRSSKYLLTSDYVNFWPKDTSQKFEPHENAFYFDEKNGAIYLSYRQISRIIKIDYPSGKVVNTYGEQFKPGLQPKGNGIFCNQHSIRRSQEGNLYLFNNNTCNGPEAVPSIVMMKEHVSGNADYNLQKVWEYNCSTDGNTENGFPFGGNVIELPDRSMFICMGSDYPKLLIVNRQKKVLWSAILEKYDNNRKIWSVAQKIYRANMISRKELEYLIWNAEKN